MPLGLATGGSTSLRFAGTVPASKMRLPLPRRIGWTQRSRRSKESLGQEGLDQIEAADDRDVLMAVTDFADRRRKVGAELC